MQVQRPHCIAEKERAQINLNLCQRQNLIDSSAQMVSVLGKLSKEGIVAEMNKHFISVMADGTRDAAGIENETVFCRFIQDGQPVNRLMGHKAVEHTHAEG